MTGGFFSLLPWERCCVFAAALLAAGFAAPLGAFAFLFAAFAAFLLTTFAQVIWVSEGEGATAACEAATYHVGVGGAGRAGAGTDLF